MNTERDLDVFTWRYERALELGYQPDHAAQLADSRTDLHDVEKLLKAGCRHDLAARIASPTGGSLP